MIQDTQKKRLHVLCAMLAVSIALNVVLFIKSARQYDKTQDVSYTVKMYTKKDVKPQHQGEKKIGILAVAKSDLIKQEKSVNVSAKSMNPHDTASNYADIFPQATNYDVDSVYLPITQKTYHKDSSYTAWVSGYCPNLDSIHVYNRTITKTITITKSKKEKRFGVGLQAGYGFGKNGATPYVGVGVQYRLFGF